MSLGEGNSMADDSKKPPAGSENTDSASLKSLFSDVIWMASAFWVSRQRNKLLTLAVALVAVVGATAYMQIRLNSWNRPFYNALTNKDMPGFLTQLGVFGKIAGILLVLNVVQMWLNQSSKVVLRQGLVNDLLNQWLKPKRAFRLSNSGPLGANPDQRLQADAQHLTDLSTDLGIGLLQSSLLLFTFVGVLWGLSNGQFLPIAGRDFAPPGYLVWCALVYAGFASYLSWRVGRPLINLNAEHYAREADFRFALVRVNEHIDGITLYGGEADERERLNSVFGGVLDISWRIVNSVTRLTWVTAGYGWFTIIAPILVAAPAYFRSNISFGELMVIVGAFNQVQTAASMVRRQFLQPRRLARDPVARGSIPESDLGYGRPRRSIEPHPIQRGGRRVDKDRRSPHRLTGGLRYAERTAYGHRRQGTCSYRRRKWRRKSVAVSRNRGSVAVGERSDHAPGAQHDHVHAGPSLYPARFAARNRCLPAPNRFF